MIRNILIKLNKICPRTHIVGTPNYHVNMIKNIFFDCELFNPENIDIVLYQMEEG
jgi:hypothetical protein